MSEQSRVESWLHHGGSDVTGKIVEFDIGDPEVAARFPSHGWAMNSQRVPVLWLPFGAAFHRLHFPAGALTPGELEARQASGALMQTIRKLAIALARLHSLDRQADQDVGTLYHAMQDTPLFVDLVFAYLRRLADQLASATRVLLFTHPGVVTPRLHKWIINPEETSKGVPTCDVERLRRALQERTGWLNIVRELRDPGQTKGVRDALEHGNTQVVVSGSFEGRALDIRMRGIRSKDPNGVDLHALIEPAIADFCSFLNELSEILGVGGGYVKTRRFVFIHGNVRDIVGYWPAI